MPIKYTLKPTMTPIQQGKFIAVVSPTYILKFTDVIAEVAEQSNCSEGVIQSVMSAYQDVIKRHLANGASVYVGNLGRVFPSLAGIYESSNAVVDKSHLRINFAISRPYAADLVANLSLEKVSNPPKEPVITSCRDQTLEAENVFTTGGIVNLMGDNLEFERHHPEEGVFVTATGAEAPFRVEFYGSLGQKHLQLTLPNTLFRNRGASGGATRLTGFTGITGSASLRVRREENGPGIKMAYREAGSTVFGTAVTITVTGAEETYTLWGSHPANSLTVTVAGERFWNYT